MCIALAYIVTGTMYVYIIHLIIGITASYIAPMESENVCIALLVCQGLVYTNIYIYIYL